MNGGTHLIIGAGSTLAALYLANAATDIPIEPATIWIGLGLAAIGSLAPDIDHPRAAISRGLPKGCLNIGVYLFSVVFLFAIFPVLSRVFNGEGILEAIVGGFNNSPIAQLLLPIGVSIVIVGLVLMLTSRVVSALFGHRGATHSLFVAVVVTGLSTVGLMLIGIVWWFGLFFGWGYLTHLLADALTEMGLPDLFWPVSRG